MQFEIKVKISATSTERRFAAVSTTERMLETSEWQSPFRSLHANTTIRLF